MGNEEMELFSFKKNSLFTLLLQYKMFQIVGSGVESNASDDDGDEGNSSSRNGGSPAPSHSSSSRLPLKRGRGRPRKYPLPEGVSEKAAASASVAAGSGHNPPPFAASNFLNGAVSVKYLDYVPDSREKRLLMSDSRVIGPHDADGFDQLYGVMAELDALPANYDFEASKAQHSTMFNGEKVGMYVFQLKSHLVDAAADENNPSFSDDASEYFVIALDLARHVGFRDSYTFFKKCGHDFEKVWTSELERCWLADIGALNPTLRLRPLALINMASVFPIYADQLRACNFNPSTVNPMFQALLLGPSGLDGGAADAGVNDAMEDADDAGFGGSGLAGGFVDEDGDFSVNIIEDDDDTVFAGRFRKKYFGLAKRSASGGGGGNIREKQFLDMVPDTFAYNQALMAVQRVRVQEFADLWSGWPLAPFRHLDSARHVLDPQALADFEQLVNDNATPMSNSNNSAFVRYDDVVLPPNQSSSSNHRCPLALIPGQSQDRFPMATAEWQQWYAAMQASQKAQIKQPIIAPVNKLIDANLQQQQQFGAGAGLSTTPMVNAKAILSQRLHQVRIYQFLLHSN